MTQIASTSFQENSIGSLYTTALLADTPHRFILDDLVEKLLKSNYQQASIQKMTQAITLLRYLKVEQRMIVNLVNDIAKMKLCPSLYKALSLLCHREIQKSDIQFCLKGFVTSETANQALWYAVDTGNIELVKRAIASGAGVNARNISYSSPLLRAAEMGWADLVTFLLQNGANAKIIGGTHDHKTPLSEALLHGSVMEPCLPELIKADNGFTKIVMNAKLLGHFFSIDYTIYIKGEPLKLCGHRPRIILPEFLSLAESFYQLQQDAFPFPIEGISETIVPLIASSMDYIHRSTDQLMEVLDQNKPITLYGLVSLSPDKSQIHTLLHAWALLIVPDVQANEYSVHRCNRGGGSLELPGVLVGRLKRDEVITTINLFKKWNQWKEPQEYTDDPLKKVDTFLQKSDSVVHHKQKQQHVGNCTVKSLLALHFAILNTIFPQDQSKILHKKFVKHVQAALLQKILNDLDDIFNEPTSNVLVTIYNLLKRKTQYQDLFDRFGQEIFKRIFSSKTLWMINNLEIDKRLIAAVINKDYAKCLTLIDQVNQASVHAAIDVSLKADDSEMFNILVGENVHFPLLFKKAIWNYSVNCVNYLLTQGVDLNDQKWPSLRVAAQLSGRSEIEYHEKLAKTYDEELKQIIISLIHAGADVNGRDVDLKTPVWNLLENNHLNFHLKRELLTLYLSNGALVDITKENNKHLLYTIANYRYDIYHLIMTSFIEETRSLDEDGKKRISSLINNLLFRAVHNPEKCKLLLELGASKEAKNSLGYKPWMVALKDSQQDSIELLLPENDHIDLNLEIFNRIWFEIFGWRQEWLIKHGFNVNLQDDLGKTRLMYLIKESRHAAAWTLLNHPATDLNIQDNYGKTVLLHAITQHFSNSFIAKILERQNDVNHQTKHGISALMYAANFGDLELVKMLIAKGANIHATNKQGKNAMQVGNTISVFNYFKEISQSSTI